MWPWGHAAVGYLVYSLLGRQRDRPPGQMAVLALGVGTQFPDLVDKPLGWTLGVLPGGRSLAHSLLTFVLVAGGVVYITRHYRQQVLGVAFAVGYFVHTLTDGLAATVSGEYAELSYLLWPVLPMPEYETEQSFIAHLAQVSLDSWLAFEGLLVVLALVVWRLDGHPGLEPLKRFFSESYQYVRHNRLLGR